MQQRWLAVCVQLCCAGSKSGSVNAPPNSTAITIDPHMSSPAWTDFVTAAGTSVAALAAVATAGAAIWAACIAKAAAETWRDTLKNQAVDESISAVRELRSAFDRVVALTRDKTRSTRVWEAYDDTWKSSWRRFDQAYAVARRYHPELRNAVEDQFAHCLKKLSALCCIGLDPAHDSVDAGLILNGLEGEFHQLTQTVENSLREIGPNRKDGRGRSS